MFTPKKITQGKIEKDGFEHLAEALMVSSYPEHVRSSFNHCHTFVKAFNPPFFLQEYTTKVKPFERHHIKRYIKLGSLDRFCR